MAMPKKPADPNSVKNMRERSLKSTLAKRGMKQSVGRIVLASAKDFGKRSEVKDSHDRYANIEPGIPPNRSQT